MLLYIKNMVCHRCKLAVQNELVKAGLHPVNVTLGEVAIEEKMLTDAQQATLSAGLQALQFELIDDKRSRIIEQIKAFIIENIRNRTENPERNYSQLLSQHLLHSYSYLSSLFSEVEGITIEQFIITQRIEKVKELLIYDELPLSDIAFQLGYSSTAHLSSQFKKITGSTPTAFKRSRLKSRGDRS